MSLSGLWLLDASLSDSAIPLLEYHHLPYSATLVDSQVQLVHIEHHSDRLTCHYYLLPPDAALASFSLSSPPPAYSVSYTISPVSAPASAFHAVRLPHRSTSARCYIAPHLQSVLVDTACHSKYDLERKEAFLTSASPSSPPLLVEEIRVLTCDPTVPSRPSAGRGDGVVGVATPFRKSLTEREVVAGNKQTVKELLTVKRCWRKVSLGQMANGSKLETATEAEADPGWAGKRTREPEQHQHSDGKAARLKLHDAQEQSEAAEQRAVKAMQQRSSRPGSSGPSPLSSPSFSSALSSVLMELTGVYELDAVASQSLSPVLRHYGLHLPSVSFTLSSAAQRRMCDSGMRPPPCPLHPVRLRSYVVIDCLPSSPQTVLSCHLIARSCRSLPLSAYPPRCFLHTATERFTADGETRKAGSSLHPEVNSVCWVEEEGVVVVESSSSGAHGHGLKERSELRRRQSGGVELLCVIEEEGKEVVKVRRLYDRVGSKTLDRALRRRAQELLSAPIATAAPSNAAAHAQEQQRVDNGAAALPTKAADQAGEDGEEEEEEEEQEQAEEETGEKHEQTEQLTAAAVPTEEERADTGDEQLAAVLLQAAAFASTAEPSGGDREETAAPMTADDSFMSLTSGEPEAAEAAEAAASQPSATAEQTPETEDDGRDDESKRDGEAEQAEAAAPVLEPEAEEVEEEAASRAPETEEEPLQPEKAAAPSQWAEERKGEQEAAAAPPASAAATAVRLVKRSALVDVLVAVLAVLLLYAVVRLWPQ